MKLLHNVFLFVIATGLILFSTACGDDDDQIIIDTGNDDGRTVFPVSPGFYIANVDGDTTISLGMGLRASLTNGGGFGVLDYRDGYNSVITYLAGGNYAFVQIDDDQKIEQRLGGMATTVDDMAVVAGSYTKVELGEGDASFNIPEGVYHVAWDQQTGFGYVIPVGDFGIQGSATEVAWTGDLINMPRVSASKDGISWATTGVVLRNGQVLTRYGNNVIGEEELFIFSFFGGTVTPHTSATLEVGGGGDNLEWAEEGIYDVTIDINSVGDMNMTFNRTGDAPTIAYDPADYPWGIIGPAGSGGWDADIDLNYIDWADSWTGLFYMEAGEFAFRTDETWAKTLKPENVTLTSANVTAAANGNFELSNAGLYHIRVVTPDEGMTWELAMDPAVPGLVGTATPNGWAGPDDNLELVASTAEMTSWQASYSFVAGEWKLRFQDGWEISPGFADVTISGASAGSLTESNGNFVLAADGTYTVVLSTMDNGATWNLSFD